MNIKNAGKRLDLIEFLQYMFIYMMLISTKQNVYKIVQELRKHDKCNH